MDASCTDFCIARPIRFVVGLALNTYYDDVDSVIRQSGQWVTA